MKARLVELKEGGAEMMLCADEEGTRAKQVYGKRGVPGTYHAKLISIDGGAVVWHGGSNATKRSRKNIECMTRVLGDATQPFVAGLYEAARSAKKF